MTNNSEIVKSHKNCDIVQDPYSFRCIPHIHGASRDIIDKLKDIINNEINSVSAGDGSGTVQDAGTVDDDDEFFQVRGAFTKSIKLKPGKIPTLKLAFGTSAALGYEGSDGGCEAAIGEAQGLYGAKPDVTATVID